MRGIFATSQPEESIQTLIGLSLNTPGSTAFALGANALLADRDWWPVLERTEIPLLYVACNRYRDLLMRCESEYPAPGWTSLPAPDTRYSLMSRTASTDYSKRSCPPFPATEAASHAVEADAPLLTGRSLTANR
ncbi:MAG: hypothetical protein AMS25_13475 [Gemmatimonas sp. SM23_52]|nr:MAG: hypothetical protein AMS25_13475 [Gemmatimonas sp. SM23_52]